MAQFSQQCIQCFAPCIVKGAIAVRATWHAAQHAAGRVDGSFNRLDHVAYRDGRRLEPIATRRAPSGLDPTGPNEGSDYLRNELRCGVNGLGELTGPPSSARLSENVERPDCQVGFALQREFDSS